MAYDMLLIGHWHQMIWLPRVIVAGTLKGYDEFAKNALRATPAAPSQPLWFVHPTDLGGIKYGINNFIQAPVAASVYISAAKRHIDDFAAGFDMDEDEPDIHNLLFARKNLEILIEAQMHGTLIDDRVRQPWYREMRRKLVEAKKRWIERKRLKDLAE